MNSRKIYGIIAGALSLVGMLFYAGSSIFGPTMPSQATWFIWTLNSVLLLKSYKASGAGETIWLAWGYVIGCGIIAILTLKYGISGLTSLDWTCLIGAILAAILWQTTGIALLGYLPALVIDLLGVAPTIYKSWLAPKEESVMAWIIMLLGGAIGLLAVKKWTIGKDFAIEVAYPVQLTFTCAIIVVLLLR